MCQVLKREVSYKDFNSRGLNPIEVKHDNGEWDNKQLVNEFRQATGKDVDRLPTIWIRGTSQYETGYTSGRRLSLLGWIIKGVKGLGALLFGNAPDGEIVPDGGPPSVPRTPIHVINAPSIVFINISFVVESIFFNPQQVLPKYFQNTTLP